MSEIKLSVDGIEYEPTGKCCVEGNDIVIRYGMHQVIFKPKEVLPKQDYKIVSFIRYDGKIDDIEGKPVNPDWYKDDNDWSIHSVKRLSDGEVFTVGNYFLTANGKIDIIKSFAIIGDEMYMDVIGETSQRSLSNIKHEPKPKVPLFTTVNFESIYEGDEYYYSPKVTLAWVNKAVKGHPQPPESFYYFKSFEEAEQYQLDNKSILVNYNEFMECIDMQLSNRLTNSIRDIFKSKINGKSNSKD